MDTWINAPESRRYFKRRGSKVTAREPIVIVAVLCLGIFMALLFIEPKTGYASININELESTSQRIVSYGSETYLVYRLSQELEHDSSEAVLRGRRLNGEIVDPPLHNEQIGQFRVFSLHEYMGATMLPASKWWDMTVPCTNLQVVREKFEFHRKELSGGVVCLRSISPWWDGQLAYDLNGYSQSNMLANLYVPHYHLFRGELHIGARHNHSPITRTELLCDARPDIPCETAR